MASPVDESVSTEKVVEEKPKTLNRFRGLALKVLTDVVAKNENLDERKNSIESKSEEGGEKDGEGKSSKVASTPKRRAAPRRLSFATVVGLAAIKNGKRKTRRKQDSESKEEEEDSESDEEYAKTMSPRFCATLSKEAQLATLKCYEDILVEKLVTSCDPTDLKRQPTPKETTRREPVKLSRPTTVPDPVVKEPIDSVDRMRISGRFQKALNLLDHLDQERFPNTNRKGEIKDPVRKFNSWSRQWHRDFKAQ